ncbi:MAG: hypothetical protein M1436_09530 [Acidobacteria bacterium]|nr:hypothetical protein [Acidobacteriota bacterium]
MTVTLPMAVFLLAAAPACAQLYESRERPDMAGPSSPRGLRVVQVTAGGQRGSWNVYTEAPVFTPDSSRFVFVRDGAYWLCDVKNRFALRPLIEEKGATAPSVSPDGKWVYYIITAPGLKLKRISLKSFRAETLLSIEDKVPGTAYRPSRIYGLSSISSDGRKLCTSAFLGDGKTPKAPFGLLVFDLAKRTASVIVLGADYNNAHPQYCRSKDPRFRRDILVQHNHGSVVDESGRTLTLVGGAGADLHVVRDDGRNWRDIPIGRDGTERVQGHQQWRGRMNSVLSAMSARGRNRILEGFPISTGERTSHTGAAIPGGRHVDITRGIERAEFVHFSPDDSGMHIVSDTRGADPKTKQRYAGLVMM